VIDAVTPDSYLSDLLAIPALEPVLTQYGLKQAADAITVPNMMRMFANVPLRAGTMIGLDITHLDDIITAANQVLGR